MSGRVLYHQHVCSEGLEQSRYNNTMHAEEAVWDISSPRVGNIISCADENISLSRFCLCVVRFVRQIETKGSLFKPVILSICLQPT